MRDHSRRPAARGSQLRSERLGRADHRPWQSWCEERRDDERFRQSSAAVRKRREVQRSESARRCSSRDCQAPGDQDTKRIVVRGWWGNGRAARRVSLGLQGQVMGRSQWSLGSSGGLRGGVELILLAGNASDGLRLALGATIFRHPVAEFRREGCNRSKAKNLLWRERNTDKRRTGDDLK